VYSDPEVFRPERFLGDAPEQDPREYAFGFGRRVCPGQQVGEASVFAACATALAAVEVGKALDPSGKPIEPTCEYIERSIRQPRDFPCSIKTRSAHASSMLREAYEATRP
jgi:cytochrome P450